MFLNAVLKGLCLLAPEGGLKCQDSQCGVLGRGENVAPSWLEADRMGKKLFLMLHLRGLQLPSLLSFSTGFLLRADRLPRGSCLF